MKAYYFVRSVNSEMLKYADELVIKEALKIGKNIHATSSRDEAVRYLVEQREYTKPKAEQMVGYAESNTFRDWIRV